MDKKTAYVVIGVGVLLVVAFMATRKRSSAPVPTEPADAEESPDVEDTPDNYYTAPDTPDDAVWEYVGKNPRLTFTNPYIGTPKAAPVTPPAKQGKKTKKDAEPFVFASTNMNWARNSASHLRDLQRITKAHPKVTVILCQETNPSPPQLPGWSLYSPHEDHTAAIYVKNGQAASGFSSTLCAKNKHGQAINDRTFLSVTVPTPVGDVTLIDVHFPPRRMRKSGLYEEYAATLRGIATPMSIPTGDWNKTKLENPAGLKAKGFRFRGPGIDQFAVGPKIPISKFRYTIDPWSKRLDGHPVIIGHIG